MSVCVLWQEFTASVIALGKFVSWDVTVFSMWAIVIVFTMWAIVIVFSMWAGCTRGFMS